MQNTPMQLASHGQPDSGGSFANPVNARKQQRMRDTAAFQDLKQ